MTDSIYKKGDIVRLKSGSPDLTVIYTGPDAEGNWLVAYSWIDGTGNDHTKTSPEEALEFAPKRRYNQPGPPPT